MRRGQPAIHWRDCPRRTVRALAFLRHHQPSPSESSRSHHREQQHHRGRRLANRLDLGATGRGPEGEEQHEEKSFHSTSWNGWRGCRDAADAPCCTELPTVHAGWLIGSGCSHTQPGAAPARPPIEEPRMGALERRKRTSSTLARAANWRRRVGLADWVRRTVGGTVGQEPANG